MFKERLRLLKREQQRSNQPFLKTVIYLLARKVVDLYRGENNSTIKSNGELGVIRKYIKDGDTVFDVGANRGEWTQYVVAHHPTCIVHCFEPSSFTFQKLTATRFKENIHCQKIAFGSRPGTVELNIFEEGSGTNSLFGREGTGKKPKKVEPVRMNTLDDYCREQSVKRIDFLKLDVEGNEMDVFKGAEGMLKKGLITTIQFEYGGCNIDAGVLLKDLFTFLLPLNYSIYKIMPNKLMYMPKYDQDLENFQTTNFLAILSGKSSTQRL